MTWIQFLGWITGIYFFYYLINFSLDLYGTPRAKAGAAMSNELTFAESVTPEVITHDPVPALKTEGGNDASISHQTKNKPEPEVIGSGGVPLKTVFRLAQAEVIHYSKHVAY